MTFRSVRRVPVQDQYDCNLLAAASGLPWAPKQLREKVVPVVSHPLATTFALEMPASLEKLSDVE